MMQFEVGDEDIKHNYEGDSNNILVDQTLYSKARLQFVRKVYSILSIQLFVTVMTTLASMYNTAFRNFQLNQTWVIYPMIALLIVSEIGIFCTKSGRKAPGSYVFLTMFTLAESYLVSLVCAAVGEQESKEIVLTAAVMTLGMLLFSFRYRASCHRLRNVCTGGLYYEDGNSVCSRLCYVAICHLRTVLANGFFCLYPLLLHWSHPIRHLSDRGYPAYPRRQTTPTEFG